MPAPANDIHPPSTVSQAKDLIETTLSDGKAQDIVVINLQGKSAISDFMIVASGTSNRHVHALADQLQRAFRDHSIKQVKVQGLQQADWVLIDTGDIIIHLFRPEVREFYNLEKVWTVEPNNPKIVAN